MQKAYQTQISNLDNWNYCHYSAGQLKAFISFGMEPGDSEDELNEIYWVTVRKDDEIDMFQKEFDILADAITFLNSRYGHWDFIDTTLKGSGCSDCGNAS